MRVSLRTSLSILSGTVAIATVLVVFLVAPGGGTGGIGLWGRVALAAGVGLACGFVGAPVIERIFLAPVRGAADRLRGFARETGVPEVPPGTSPAVNEVADVVSSIDGSVRDLGTRISTGRAALVELSALTNSLPQGVLALSADGHILRSNPAARAMLGLAEEYPTASVGSLVRQRDLRAWLGGATSRDAGPTELEVGERRLVLASRIVDLVDGDGISVVTLADVTELRRLERVRRDFVANASHELKTPLTAMRGFAETLLDGAPDEATRQRFMERIHENALRLQRLVDDLLDLSRLESGGWVPKPSEIDLETAATAAWAQFAEQASAQGVAFSVHGRALASADPQALGQILTNLYDNALRHTRTGEVRVEIDDLEVGVVLTVRDTGEGIPAHDLDRVFERFYRADAARSRDRGGTGLGLSIVRHLVEAMGGSATADSRLGEWTAIGVQLPAAGQR